MSLLDHWTPKLIEGGRPAGDESPGQSGQGCTERQNAARNQPSLTFGLGLLSVWICPEAGERTGMGNTEATGRAGAINSGR